MRVILFVLLILVVSCSKDDPEPDKIFTSIEGIWKVESGSVNATFTITEIDGVMLLVSGEYEVADEYYTVAESTEASLTRFVLKQDEDNYYVFKDLMLPPNADNFNELDCYHTEYMYDGTLSNSSMGLKRLKHIK